MSYQVASALFPLVALAACQSGAAPAENKTGTEAGSPADTQAQLESLPQAQRDAVFLRAIRDAKRDCQHVQSSQRAGESAGLPVWQARCEQDKSYTIVITAGGTVQVLDDSEVRLSHEAPPKDGGRGQ